MLLKIISRLLEKLKYQSDTVLDGNAAIERFRNAPNEYICAIIDYNLNGMSCRQTLVELRKINPNLKAVISTGELAEDKMKELKDVGVIAALQKPYTVQDLQDVLNKIN